MSSILLIGDVMLDEYVYGDVARISPEAASPVLAVTRTDRMIGGAGNVAMGIAALDCDVEFLSVCNASDEAGRVVMNELQKVKRITPWIVCEERRTTQKTRYVSEAHSSHLLRVDSECTKSIVGATELSIINSAARSIVSDDCDVVVISDYRKGVVTWTVAKALVDMAKLAGKIVIVDSKANDITTRFNGATIVKVNLPELETLVGHKCEDGEAIKLAAMSTCIAGDFDHVVVTVGGNGAWWACRHTSMVKHVPGHVVRVRDVSGAGDTFVAALATSLAGDGFPDMSKAVARAVWASAIAVSKPGTATVTEAELEGGKIAKGNDWSLLDQRLREWRGQKIGLTNGCFDILHSGHLYALQRAKGECDKLIVALNSDASVHRLKGEGRPIQCHAERAEVLSHLDYVDLIVIFDADDPTAVCERVRPDVMFKGSEWADKEIKGREYATVLHLIEREPGSPSTTDTIAKIQGGVLDRIVNDRWCEECHGPCLRRPKHGENNV